MQHSKIQAIGRILLALIFVVYGFDKAFGFIGGGFSGTSGAIASKGLPLPDVLTAITILIEAGGGLMLLFGFKTRLAAWAIFLLLIPITFFFHPAWSDIGQLSSFLKNLAVMGGMLCLVAHGPGAWAVDKR